MGGEFIPTLDEDDILHEMRRIPGTSLSQSLEMQGPLERATKEFPEVKDIFPKIGAAEIANDPMLPNQADNYIILKPRAEWPNPSRSNSDLIVAIDRRASEFPGSSFDITQPIQMRFNELISGVRSDVGIKIFGDDLETLRLLAGRVQSIVKTIPGVADLKTEQVAGPRSSPSSPVGRRCRVTD